MPDEQDLWRDRREIGGQAELARLLAEEGRTVWTSGVAGCPDLPAQAAAADVVILPLPLCPGGRDTKQ